jgi:C4-dicarboxylate transporter/malic acid transport protein
MKFDLKTFHPAWFALTLSTAGTGLMALFDPFDFSTLDLTMGIALTSLAAFLLILIFSLMLVRFRKHPTETRADFFHPNFGPLFAAAPASLLVISVSIGELMRQGFLDREIFEPIAIVLIIIGGIGTLLVGFQFYGNVVNTAEVPVVAMNGSWFIPVVPLILIPSALIRLVIDNSNAYSTWYALGFVSAIITSAALFLFFILAAIIGYRLLTKTAPSAHAIATWWIWLAPLGVGGLATIATYKLLSFGVDANARLETGYEIATFLWGAGIWWLLFASTVIWKSRKEMHFHIGYWGFGFPSAAFTSLTLQMHEHWGFEVLHYLAMVMAALTIGLWIWLSGLTITGIKSGKVFQRA